MTFDSLLIRLFSMASLIISLALQIINKYFWRDIRDIRKYILYQLKYSSGVDVGDNKN